MRGREDLTLDQAIRRAGSAGTLVRHEAVAVFLEVLRLATESQVVPDAAATLLGEDGSLTFAQDPSPQAAGAGDPIQAAGRLATGLFGAARIEPPLALGSGGEGSAERFPTLRHLRDAFELDLLLSGTPAPTDVERRMAIAALVAKARQLRGTSAGPKERRPQAAREQLAPASDPSTRITEPPAPASDPSTRITEPPAPASDPSTRITEPPAPASDPSTRITEPPAPASDPSTRITEPPAPASDPSTRITEPPAPARWRPPRWLPLVAAGGMGILAGLLLHREPSRPPLARAAPAAPAPEIPLPPLDAPIGPAVADSRPGPRERAAPAAAPSQDPAPRPVRKLRRRAAAADAGAAARAKLQLGDESLKQGHFFEAVIAFREALNQDPPLPLAARRLGDAYRTHQDDDLALAAYERYLELDPAAQDADEVRDAVEQLRSGASPPR